MVENLSRQQKLHEELWRIIAETEAGQRLLNEPDLARQLGVSRATLREAMRTFETQGLIRRRQGSGTYVVRPSRVIESGLELLESIESLSNKIGLDVSMGELSVEYRLGNPSECKALGLEPAQRIIHLSRVIMTEDRSVAYLIDILPDKILSPEEIQAGFTGSVLDVLLQRGSPTLVTSLTEISATGADQKVARALGVQRGAVLLVFNASLYSADGQIVDYSTSYFLPGYFRFHVVRRVLSPQLVSEQQLV
ncbi:MAG: GntR family transcriptional regulator [Anaerolineales bacterium]|jgi:GntR family transcriptional regulator